MLGIRAHHSSNGSCSNSGSLLDMSNMLEALIDKSGRIGVLIALSSDTIILFERCGFLPGVLMSSRGASDENYDR